MNLNKISNYYRDKNCFFKGFHKKLTKEIPFFVNINSIHTIGDIIILSNSSVEQVWGRLSYCEVVLSAAE